MTSETKQQVLDELLTEAYGYSVRKTDIYRARYAAASDGDPACPYCNTPSGRETTKQEYINDYMTDEATYDPVDTLDNGMLACIICCQWCGRRLEASHEPA